MPRNPENKRVEILLTTEQYDVIVRWAKVYRMIDPAIPEDNAAIAEAIRALMTRAIPEFAKAKPLPVWTKHKKKMNSFGLCPNCGAQIPLPTTVPMCKACGWAAE